MGTLRSSFVSAELFNVLQPKALQSNFERTVWTQQCGSPEYLENRLHLAALRRASDAEHAASPPEKKLLSASPKKVLDPPNGCNLRKRAAGATLAKFLRLGYQKGLKESVEVWAYRARQGDGAATGLPRTARDNLASNPAFWKRGKLVMDKDCGPNESECLAIRWRDGTNTNLFTTPRWILVSRKDPRKFITLGGKQEGKGKGSSLLPEHQNPIPTPTDITDLVAHTRVVFDQKFRKIFGGEETDDAVVNTKELQTQYTEDGMRGSVLEAVCFRFFGDKGSYAKEHDGLTAQDAWHALKKFGFRVFKVPKGDEDVAAKSKQAGELPEDEPPEGIDKDFCVVSPSSEKKDPKVKKPKKKGKIGMKTAKQLVDLGEKTIRVEFPRKVDDAYDLPSCDVSAGDGVARTRAPPVFRFLSKEHDPQFAQLAAMFSHTPPCYGNSAGDCFVRDPSEMMVFRAALKENAKNFSFVYDARSNSYAVCQTDTGVIRCLNLQLTQHPVLPVFPTSGEEAEVYKDLKTENLQKRNKALSDACTKKCAGDGKKLRICFLPDAEKGKTQKKKMENVYCRDADDVLVLAERDRKLQIGSEVEVLDRSRGGRDWLRGKVREVFKASANEEEEGGDEEEASGGEEKPEPTTSLGAPCPKAGCAKIDFLQADGSWHGKLNASPNRVYPISIPDKIRFPTETS